MNRRLNRRVTELERQNRTGELNLVETAEERLRRGALCSLSPDELEATRDYAEQLQEDPDAKPNPAQTAAIETYEQRYRELRSSGKPVVDGWPSPHGLPRRWSKRHWRN